MYSLIDNEIQDWRILKACFGISQVLQAEDWSHLNTDSLHMSMSLSPPLISGV